MRNWTDPRRVSLVMKATDCDEITAKEYLLAEEGVEEDAIVSIRVDRMSTYEPVSIGSVNHEYGRDAYLLFKDVIHPGDVRQFLKRYMFEGYGPGSMFCNSASVIADPRHPEKVIGVVHYRYNA